jgi:anaerobic selenocysteine-containing dehydrogenase
MIQQKKTFCSICSAFCGFDAEVEDNRIVGWRADRSHPMSGGFSCSKGRHFPDLLTSEKRVSHCRQRSGEDWINVDKSQALDKIAAKISALVAEHGPESVAVYCGNGVTFKALVMPAVHSFMRSLGSHQIYTSLTIDQPAKIISVGRHGVWAGGGHSFESAKVLMLLGNNVLVSGLHGPGSIPGWRPGALKEARARGLKLIVVDPRRTETAQQADLYLPIKPGTDAVFLSGVINWVIQNELHDADFCEQFTAGLEELAARVARYDLDQTAAITGLDKALIKQAAELFVSQGRGTVSSATGPDMAPHGNLTEHLIYSLNSLCGRHNRAGERVNASLLTPDFPPIAAVVPWDFLPDSLNPAKNIKRSRVNGAHQIFNEMPTATLAEEILTPGSGQIKALLVVGGNPLLSIPDQAQVRRALEALELCVLIDGRHSDTADYADYFLPATYGLEKLDMTVFNDIFWDRPFHQITLPVVDAPDDAQDEVLYLMALANRLGTSMSFGGVEVDTGNPPDSMALLNLCYPAGTTRVTMDEIAAHAGGHVFEQFEALEVIPAMEGMEDRLRFMPEGVPEEFDQLQEDVARQLAQPQQEGDYLLICRRNAHVYNSMCHDFPQAPTHNPVYMHPQDLAAAGLTQGQSVHVQSDHGAVTAALQTDDSLRRGVVAMHHGFGGDGGATVGRLLTTEGSTDRYARIPQMTAVRVRLQ